MKLSRRVSRKEKPTTTFGQTAYRSSIATIVGIAIIGLLAPLICSPHPLIYKNTNQETLWPWSTHQDQDVSHVILYPLVHFDNSSIDKENINWQPPGSTNSSGAVHYLGSSKLGKDVAAGMIYGCRVALSVGGVAIGVALLIGLCIGLLSGYYQDKHLKINILQTSWTLLLIPLSIYYLISGLLGSGSLSILFSLLIIGIFLMVFNKLQMNQLKDMTLPVDGLFTKLIEIRKSIPVLYLLLVVSKMIDHVTVWSLGLIIGVLIWVPFARHSRVLTMAMVNDGPIIAAKALGLSDLTIMIRHVLREIAPQIAVIAAFGMSGAILLESTLSFLGMGIPKESLTWGSMLAEAKQYPKAWWMAVFPGLGIFLTVLSFNIIGEKINEIKQHHFES